MKSFLFFLLTLTFTGLIVSSCNNNITYADELASEQQLITGFIKRNEIKVVNVMPTSFPWPDKVFYKSKTGLYYRLTAIGDTLSGDTVEAGDMVVTRFLQYTLHEQADTLSNLSTLDFPYPTTFSYLDYAQACPGWHEAVGYMKRHNSEATVIVYSRLGFSQFNRPATPIGYDLKIKIQKNN
jgi:hypothetical protein